MTMKLFDDDDNSAPNGDGSNIEINEEYARRLEYNRKRQDLQRYEELKNKGLIDDEDSDESEESEPEDDFDGAKFFEALNKVKKQDPSLKSKDVKLFDSDESESEGEDSDRKRGDENGHKRETKEKKKKMFLKDVQAKHVVEGGLEFSDEEEEDKKYNKNHVMTYNEEQEELRKKFLDAVETAEDDENEEDILVVKQNEKEELEKGGEDEEFVKKLDEYFGEDEELDENKKFLKDFFMKKLWVDKDDKGKEALLDEDELDHLEEDEEEIERQEDYETSFRYEENAGDRVMGHSRKVEGSVRKKENARKEQRKSKEERMRIAETERQEELKYLKNLKKKEIKERMNKVLSIAGFKDSEDCPFSAKDLDKEFDPEEYDRMMKSVFDENYYDGEDSGIGSDEDGDEKPDFDKEDELLGLPKNWDVIKPGDGFVAVRESLKDNMEDATDNDVEEEEMQNSDSDGHESSEEENGDEKPEEDMEESKRKRKRKVSLVQKAKEALMDEYYKLDYEDTIGDLKTRFRYAKVKPNRFGLSSEELLGVEEKELNQYVSLKKIAPYREKEWKVPDSKRHQQKIKNKDLLRNKVDLRSKNKDKKRRRDNDEKRVLDEQDTGKKISKGETADGKSENGGETSNLSKSAKRRRRQSEYKLPRSRLVAYGKI